MKKLIIIGALILALCVGLLSGCGYGNFSLCHWSSSNTAFNNLINTLDTPKKAIDWTRNNCTHEAHSTYYSPYEFYTYKKGVCADYTAFGMYAAHKHGYTSYEMILRWQGSNYAHSVGVYLVDGRYDYSSNGNYRDVNYTSFSQIANDFPNLDWYVVEDYCDNLVTHDGITKSTIFYPMDGIIGGDSGSFIGSEPINRPENHELEKVTIINGNLPAQCSGTIDEVRIYAHTQMTSVVIAIFYKIGATSKFTTGDYVVVGTVPAGENVFLNCDLDVEVGGYIGMKANSGSIEKDTSVSGSLSVYVSHYRSIPCRDYEFDHWWGCDISIGGLVITDL